MAAVVLVSAKGSPGVTTTAAVLTAVARAGGSQVLLAEMDPSGGSVQVFTGRAASPGLVEAAGRLRRDRSGAAFEGHVTTLPEGIPVLLAPSAGVAAESVLDAGGDRWLPALGAYADVVVADAGRWSSTQRCASRIAGADLTVIVCRPTVADVEASRHLLDRLREATRRQPVVVVAGQRPYAPEEVASFLDLPLAGRLAWDPKAVAQLWATGATRRWLRTRLARSATRTWTDLWQSVPVAPPPPPSPPSPSSVPPPPAPLDAVEAQP